MPRSPTRGGIQDPSSHNLVLPRRSDGKLDPHEDGHPRIAIPKIQPLTSEESLPIRARGLVGKFVDEFGNILDWGGTVVGCVEGDLPSIVGRPVSESGEVLDSSGEVAGYVSENHTDPPLKDLESGLKVDESGNIYNQHGFLVGKMNDASSHAHETTGSDGGAKKAGSGSSPSPAAPSPSEVYLDVKSTHDGIQLIIKIPAVLK